MLVESIQQSTETKDTARNGCQSEHGEPVIFQVVIATCRKLRNRFVCFTRFDSMCFFLFLSRSEKTHTPSVCLPQKCAQQPIVLLLLVRSFCCFSTSLRLSARLHSISYVHRVAVLRIASNQDILFTALFIERSDAAAPPHHPIVSAAAAIGNFVSK